MGEQLSEGNPNIADLSDLDRPTKLGERYNELYDNEWTNALDYLLDVSKGNKDEEEAIELLYYLLTECHIFCGRKLEEQMDLLERDLLFSDQMESNVKDTNLSSGVRKTLKQARKSTSANAYGNLLKRFYGHLSARGKISPMELQSVKTYTEECFKLCYQMCLHDPPLSLGSRPARDESFDGNTYKEYTVSGTKIDFVVLPPLYLHKSGPLLCKGVAQPIKSDSKRKKSSKFETDHNTTLPDKTSNRKSKDLYMEKEDENTTIENETGNGWLKSANLNTSHAAVLSTHESLTNRQIVSQYKSCPIVSAIPVEDNIKTALAKSLAFQHTNPRSKSHSYSPVNTENDILRDADVMYRETQCREKCKPFIDLFYEGNNRGKQAVLNESYREVPRQRMQEMRERDTRVLQKQKTEKREQKWLDEQKWRAKENNARDKNEGRMFGDQGPEHEKHEDEEARVRRRLEIKRRREQLKPEQEQDLWRLKKELVDYIWFKQEQGVKQRREQELRDKVRHELEQDQLRREQERPYQLRLEREGYDNLRREQEHDRLKREREQPIHQRESQTRGQETQTRAKQPVRPLNEHEKVHFKQEAARKRREKLKQEREGRFREKHERERQVHERYKQQNLKHKKHVLAQGGLRQSNMSQISFRLKRKVTKTGQNEPWRF